MNERGFTHLQVLMKAYLTTRTKLTSKGSPYDQHVLIQNRLEVALGEAGATGVNWNDDFTVMWLTYKDVRYKFDLSGQEPKLLPLN